jgi:hypothetical protein
MILGSFPLAVPDRNCGHPGVIPPTIAVLQSPNSTMMRHLSSLKVISRLLGHELHSQTAGKSITLSREEVIEIQTSLDIFIEEASRKASGSAGGSAAGRSANVDTTLVPTRN